MSVNNEIMSVNNEIMSVNNEIMSNENIVISNSEIIGNSELKNEQVVKKVTKRIRKKKFDENVINSKISIRKTK